MKKILFLFLLLPFSLSLLFGKDGISIDEDNLSTYFEYNRLIVKLLVLNRTHREVFGKLKVEIVDVDDETLSKGTKWYNLKWKEQKIVFSLPYKHDKKKLFLKRLKYSFISRRDTVKGVVSLSQILTQLETHILGYSEFIEGSNASLRVVTLNQCSGEPIFGARVKIVLNTKGKEKVLYRGITNKYGTVDVSFNIPEGIEKGELEITVKSSYGEDKLVKNVNIKKGTQIYLVTDKPIYQPNQKIYIRTLSLKKPYFHPVKREKILIEVEDSKGNKVFKIREKTDEFGVASTQFQLADEINFGKYTIFATIGEITQEKTVMVNRYVLPKFKIDFKTDKDYYLPGESLKGDISVNYFFEKPVSGARVKIRCKKFDVGFSTFEVIDGTTNKNGNFEFELRLPDYFIGLPLEQGNAFIQFELEVEDRAEHIELTTEKVKVEKDPIRITIVPESGELIPNVKNRIYIMTAYPDGKPAKTKLEVETAFGKEDMETDDIGIASFYLTPTDTTYTISIAAVDEKGMKGELKKDFKLEEKEDCILLRMDRALYKVGEQIRLDVLATKKQGIAYLDVIKNNQTMLTKSLEVKDGVGSFGLDLTNELSGSIFLSVYIITKKGDIVRDTKALYVNAANDLNIGIALNKDTYKPGEEALLDFLITNKEGKGCSAVLGIAVIDEAVFSITELKPGMEKIYFTLESELAEPRYEIHGFTPAFIVGVSENDMIKKRELMAEASNLFFAPYTIPQYDVDINTYKDKSKELRENGVQMVAKDKIIIRGAVRKYYNVKKEYPDKDDGIGDLLTAGILRKEFLLDPWRVPYRVTFINSRGRFEIVSSGPDKLFDTEDDIEDHLLRDVRVKVRPTIPGSAKVVKITQGKGEGITGKIMGKVFDACTGEPLPSVNIRILGTTLGALTNLEGGFLILNIPPGEYNLQAHMMGYETMTLKSVEVRTNYITEVEFNLAMQVIKMSATTVIARKIIEPDVTASAPMLVAKAEKPVEEPQVRRYFPETLFFNPSLITDKDGNASLKLKLADSITKWRMSITSSSKKGELGSTEKGIRVFQDFFVDLDLPIALTDGDKISIPVAIYNYLPTSQKIELKLESDSWFELLDETSKKIELKKDEVTVIYFRICAKEIGYHKLLIKAFGEYMSDAIEKGIEVVPDGKVHYDVVSDRLEKNVDKTVVIPTRAIDDAFKILVRIYPGIFSQIVEGLDALLRMPFGCFEQTSSVTYPNVLVLDYTRRTEQVTPELEIKAEEYINLGYQRLLSFEVKGGGFSWFGKTPANKLLTAFALMEFNDMIKVYEIDKRLIDRTAKWLLSKQEKNGSFLPDKRYLHAETWAKFEGKELLSTAYITWALLDVGTRDTKIDKAINFIKNNLEKVEEPYTLSICANALVSYDKNDKSTKQAFEKLNRLRVKEGNVVYWRPLVSSITNTRGKGAQIETTALVCYALIKYGKYGDALKKALTYLIQSKGPHGRWYSTQTTILVLRALLASLGEMVEETDGEVVVKINGRECDRIRITPQECDVVRMLDLKGDAKKGENKIKLLFKGEGSLLYEIVSKYYLSWKDEPRIPQKLLSIDVKYDKKKLIQNDIVGVKVNVQNNSPGIAHLVIVDLGIPPGFQVLTPDLDELVEKKTIEKYSITGRQIIVYLDRIESGKPVNFAYHLRAKYPLLAKTGESRVYEYYNPEVETVKEPFEIEVK